MSLAPYHGLTEERADQGLGPGLCPFSLGGIVLAATEDPQKSSNLKMVSHEPTMIHAEKSNSPTREHTYTQD